MNAARSQLYSKVHHQVLASQAPFTKYPNTMFTLIALVLFTLLCIGLRQDHAWSSETHSARNALVFSNRNRQYGAFRLREEYGNHLAYAFLVALGIGAAAVGIPWCMAQLSTRTIGLAQRPVVVDVDLSTLFVAPSELPHATGRKAPAPAALPQQTPKSTGYVQAADTVAAPPALPMDTGSARLGTANPVGSSPRGGSAATPGSSGTVPGPDESTLENFEVQQVPEFPGGPQAMAEWVRQNMDFPPEVTEKDLVYVQFTVGTDGTVQEVKAIKGRQTACLLAAERTLRRMPKWKPALMNGHNVRCRLTLPIKFETR